MRKINQILLTLFVVIIFSCESKDTEQEIPKEFTESVELEMQMLSTEAQLKLYLGDMNRASRAPREKDAEFQLKGDIESEEYLQNKADMARTNAQNKVRLEAYFKNFGYPTKDNFGLKGTSIPIDMIDGMLYEVKLSFFKTLYDAYEKGDIDPTKFETFIDGMYLNKFNEQFKMKSPYRMEDKIDTLMTLLEIK